MKEYTEEPKIGPTEKKTAGKLDFDHGMLHGSDEMVPGHRVKLIVHGHVTSNRGKDEYGPGHVNMDIHSVEHHPQQDSQENKSKKPNVSEMRMDDLRKHIQDMSEALDKRSGLDKDMEGHSESGIKEEKE